MFVQRFEVRMTTLNRLSLILAGCLLASGIAGSASAQPSVADDWDTSRDWRDRPQERSGVWIDRDRGWDQDRARRWRGRDRDCYYETRRQRNRFGEVVVRRYRVCED